MWLREAVVAIGHFPKGGAVCMWLREAVVATTALHNHMHTAPPPPAWENDQQLSAGVKHGIGNIRQHRCSAHTCERRVVRIARRSSSPKAAPS